MLSRNGARRHPGSGRFGNTVVELTPKDFRLHYTFTPANRE